MVKNGPILSFSGSGLQKNKYTVHIHVYTCGYTIEVELGQVNSGLYEWEK